MKRAFSYALLFGLLATLVASVALVAADSNSIDFETGYSLGNINGQNGWQHTGPHDVAVADVSTFPNAASFGFGTKSLRISNAVTTNAFADQTYAPPLSQAAGEGSLNYYEANFDIGAALSTEQAGMSFSVSPDDGTGSRMSYLRFDDMSDGIHVFFRDVTNPGPLNTASTFNTTDIATIDRTSAHDIQFKIWFVTGAHNDVVRIYIDGALAAEGTTWEDYYRFDPEQNGNGNVLSAIDTLIFRAAGTAVPTNSGNGFLLDNFNDYETAAHPACTTTCYVDTATGNDAFPGTSLAEAKKTIQGGINAVSPGGTVLVNDGTYVESPDVTKSLTLQSINGKALTNIQLQTGPTYLGSLFVAGDDVTVDGFTILGRDGTASDVAASNILVENGHDDVVVKNNTLKVGALGPIPSLDASYGIITYYNTTPAQFTQFVTVSNNVFQPLTTTGQRAFYVNPGVGTFKFVGNTVTGNFLGGAVTQADTSLVNNNTVTGTGSSGGFSAAGYTNPLPAGSTTFQGNTISGVTTGINVDELNNVTVTKNRISTSTNAVRIRDFNDFASFDPSTIAINRNGLAVGSSNNGIVADTLSSSVDGTCNWWGNFSGPGPVASGTGSKVTSNVEYAPWLQSSNLDSECSPNGNLTIVLDSHPNSARLFSFTGTNGIAPFTLKDDGTPGANMKTFNKPAGLYVFRVGALPKWALIKLTCNTHETILRSHRLAQIQLHSDENVTCTFTESYRVPDASIALSSGGPYSGDNIYSGGVLASQSLAQSFSPGQTKSFFVRLQNDGLDEDTFRVVSKLKGSLKYGVVFMAGNVEITGKVNAGTYKFALAPGATRMIEIRVTAGAIGGADVRNIILTMQSKTAPDARDTVKAFVNSSL